MNSKESTEEKIEALLISTNQKEALLKKLDTHIKQTGFYDKILTHINMLMNKGLGQNDFDVIFNDTYEYVCKNMPEEVEGKFYGDTKKFIDEYVQPSLK